MISKADALREAEGIDSANQREILAQMTGEQGPLLDEVLKEVRAGVLSGLNKLPEEGKKISLHIQNFALEKAVRLVEKRIQDAKEAEVS